MMVNSVNVEFVIVGERVPLYLCPDESNVQRLGAELWSQSAGVWILLAVWF